MDGQKKVCFPPESSLRGDTFPGAEKPTSEAEIDAGAIRTARAGPESRVTGQLGGCWAHGAQNPGSSPDSGG